MNQIEKMFSIDVHKVDLTEFNYDGRILDIGGGGEGIIGQIMGEKVVAIDLRVDELREAGDGPLKIIMDARELKFLDNTFDAVTSFFTLMYIDGEYHSKIFKEIYRVLKNEGEFTIWDVTIPRYQGGIKDIFLVPLEIKMKDKQVSTTYGVSWKEAEQNLSYYVQIGEKVGFEIISQEVQNQIYSIRFKKRRQA